jgi:hypothetical protein
MWSAETVINPKDVVIAIPCHDGRMESGCAVGLHQIAARGMAPNLMKLDGCSNVALVRNVIAAGFLRMPYQWLVGIDSDIEFSPDDYAILMDWHRAPPPPLDQELHDRATLIEITPHNAPSYKAAAMVCAEYARKEENAVPVRLGYGFVRIHRSVFERLDALNNESGAARIDDFMYEGKMVKDYYLSGCSEHRWLGEDTGFFALARLAGIHPRIEQRTNLIHWGRKAYRYFPQDAIQ